MGDNPTTVNKTATMVNASIYTASNAMVSVAKALAIAEVPFLNIPIFKQVWEALFNWVANYFIRAAQMGATFAIIDSQVNREEKKMTDALAAVVEAEKSGDTDAIKKAVKDYANAQSNLVHNDGSARI